MHLHLHLGRQGFLELPGSPDAVFGKGSANLGLFLDYKKLCGGDFRGGHLSHISTPSESKVVRYAFTSEVIFGGAPGALPSASPS